MRAKTGASILAIAALAAVILPARAEDQAVRRAIESEYQSLAQSYRQSPPRNLTQFFRAALMWGPYQEVPGRNGDDSVVQARDVAVTVDNVAVNGNRAVVTVTKRMSARYGQPRPGQSGVVSSTAVERHTWVKGPTGWLLMTERPLNATINMNGTVYPVNRYAVFDPNAALSDMRTTWGMEQMRP